MDAIWKWALFILGVGVIYYGAKYWKTLVKQPYRGFGAK